MIKKENKRITITLTQEEITYLDMLLSEINKKTYTQAIRMLIKLFILTHIEKK